jgi:hypothetical protein
MQNAKLKTLGHGSFILLAAALTLSAADPFMGTWNVNMAKSKYSPGPAPKSSTVTYSQDSDWIVAKIDTVSAEGTPTSSTIRYRRDGKEYPYDAPAGKGTIAVTSMNANTAHATIKVGTATTTVHTVIAKDGKSFTRTTKGTDAQGRTVNNLVVFEKQ